MIFDNIYKHFIFFLIAKYLKDARIKHNTTATKVSIAKDSMNPITQYF